MSSPIARFWWNHRWFGGGASGGVRFTLLALALTLAGPTRAATDVFELSLEQLMEIPVVGASKYVQRQSEVAASVRVITREDIRAFGWRTLAEAVASLPGVYSSFDGFYNYMGARGLSPVGDLNARMLVTINGLRYNEDITDSAPLGHEFSLDIDLVERIEYIPGPGGAVYGQNALFGVINVVTRDGAGLDGGEVTATWQSPQRQRQGRASVGRRFDSGLDLVVSASSLRARGENRFYDFGQGIAGVAIDMDRERDQEFFARVSKGSWSFELIDSDRLKESPQAYDGREPLQRAEFVRDRYLITNLQYQGPLADGSQQLFAKLFQQDYRMDMNLFRDPGIDTSAVSMVRGAELRILSTALPSHKLMMGLELRGIQRREYALDYSYPYPGWRAGVYAQDEWRLSDKLATTLGLRIDRSNFHTTRLSPRAALIWQPVPATTVKLMVGRAFREPHMKELDFRYANEYDPVMSLVSPPVASEVIDTLELGWDHLVAPDLSIRGALYHWSLKNQIVKGDEGLYVSGPRVTASGLELSADKTWGWGGRLRASVSAQRASVVHGDRLANSPRWLGKLHFSTPLPAHGLSLGYELLLESARRGVDGRRLPAYGRSNLNLSAEGWAPGLSVSLGISNLLDKAYRQPVYGAWIKELPQTGRSVRLKLEWKF